jgi:hypothetical protein
VPRDLTRLGSYAHLLLFSLLLLPAQALAQRSETDASYRRFTEFYAAANYPGALVEARKYESAVNSQFDGASYYATALHLIAMARERQGDFVEAEQLYKRSVAISEKALGRTGGCHHRTNARPQSSRRGDDLQQSRGAR